MSNRRKMLAILALLVSPWEGIAHSGLRKVWELDFREVARTAPVLAVRFSPDGRLTLVWTASGDAIVAVGVVTRVRDDYACKLLPRGESEPSFDPSVGTAAEMIHHTIKFLVLDAACQSGQKVSLPNDWNIIQISADRRLLCVWQLNDVLIVDPLAGKILRRWPIREVSGSLNFADGDRAVCETGPVEPGPVPVRCWDINNGKVIAEAKTIHGGMPASTAAQASRIVASDYRSVAIPFSVEHTEILQRRVVWDFRSGKELASWRPEFQSYEENGIRPPMQIKEPFKFAISPDGQYIVEGGNGVLRLYEVQP